MRSMLCAILSLTALAFTACSPAPSGDELFPLAKGHRWDYAVTMTREDPALPPLRETLTLHARGREDIDGTPAWRRRSESGTDYWLRSDETGIYRVASKTDIEYDPHLDNPHRYVLRYPIAVGTQWEAATTLYVLQRRNEFPQTQYARNKLVTMVYRIEALGEKIATPAGKFEGCVHVIGRATIRIFVDAMGGWRDGPLTTHEWYCPGVGLARLLREEPSASKLLSGGAMTMDLLAYR